MYVRDEIFEPWPNLSSSIDSLLTGRSTVQLTCKDINRSELVIKPASTKAPCCGPKDTLQASLRATANPPQDEMQEYMSSTFDTYPMLDRFQFRGRCDEEESFHLHNLSSNASPRVSVDSFKNPAEYNKHCHCSHCDRRINRHSYSLNETPAPGIALSRIQLRERCKKILPEHRLIRPSRVNKINILTRLLERAFTPRIRSKSLIKHN